MGEMPFFMVYGAEAVLPPEVTMGSLRVKTYDEAMQDQLRCEDIEDGKLLLKIHATGRRYHQRFVRSRELQVDDLVLRSVLSREGMNKLSPCWEGPYWVTQVCRAGCIRLATEEGEPVPRP
jgi:hypothetical protein